MSWNIAKPGDQINGPVNITGNLNVDSNTLFVDSVNNRVGVLTASPTVPLDVVGDAKVSGNLIVDTTTLVVDAANNRLGVGTATPASSLDVVGTLGVTGTATLTGALVANGNVTLGDAQADTVTVNGKLTAREGELASSIRAAASDYAGVAFDGATTATRIASGCQTIGTGDFSLWSRFRVPTSFSTSPGVIWLSDVNSATYRPNAIGVYLDPSGSGLLRVFRYGTNNATDNRIATVSNFLTNFSGQVVDIVVTRAGNTLKIFINGTDTTYTEQSAGAAPAWGQTVVSDFVFVGALNSSSIFNSTIYRAVVFNRALSVADIADLIANGINPADQWGTQTALFNTTTLNGGFETAGAGGADVFANWAEYTAGTATLTRDTTDYSPDLGSTASAKYVGTDGAAVFSLWNASAGNLIAGKRYRISAAHKRSANANVAWKTIAGNVNVATFAVTTSWANYSGEFVMPANENIKIDGNGAISLWVDNVSLERIGAIVDLDFTVGAGFQATDRSANNLHGTMFGGVSFTMPKRIAVLYGTTNTNGNQQVLGTVAIPTNAIIEDIVVNSTGTATVSVGNASAGTQIVNGASVVAGRQKLTLATPFSTTGNLWVNSNSTATLQFTILYTIAS
jgi:hypothetical protein